MKSNPKKVSINFFSITISQAFSLLLNLIAFALIARYLTVESFGNFSILLAIVGILSKIIDMGVSPIVFREKSRMTNGKNLLQTAITIRLIVFFIIQILSNIYLVLQKYNFDQILLFNILLLSIIFSSKMANVRDLLTIPFKVKLNMTIPSLLNVLDSIFFLILVILMPYFRSGLLYLAIIYVIANIPGFILLIIFLKTKYNFKFNFSFIDLQWLLKESAPLAGFVLFMSIYYQIDLLLLKQLGNSYSTGIYSSAIRLVLPLNLIPNAIVTTVFPILIRQDIERNALIQAVYKVLLFVSITFAIIFTFKSGMFVQLVFSAKYSSASLSAVVLFWSQIFMFLNFFSLSLFTADRKQTRNFYYAILIVLVNFIFDVILIPKYSFFGPSFAKLIASLSGFAYTLFFLKKLNISLNFIKLRHFIWLCSVFIGVYLVSNFSLIIYLVLSLIIISGTTYFTIYFTKKEINYFLRIIK